MLSWLKRHPWWTGIITLALVVGIVLYVRRPKPTYTPYQVKRETIRETLELSGKITADTSATLRFPTGGLVTYLGASEGDQVKKWQTLASVDTRQLQKVLEQKLNLYSIQRGTFEQTVDDNDNSVPAGDAERELRRLLEKNQFQLDNTVKDVEYQDLSLKLSRLTSPLSGILVQSPVTTSNVQVLATDTWVVVDPTSLYFSADVDETDLSRVQAGQEVVVALDAFADQTFPATISSIGYAPKETTSGTTYEVKIRLTSADLSLFRLGLNGTANVILKTQENALTLPSAALSGSNGSTTVLLQDKNKYQPKKITTGIENDGVVEIVSGLAEGETVYVQE